LEGLADDPMHPLIHENRETINKRGLFTPSTTSGFKSTGANFYPNKSYMRTAMNSPRSSGNESKIKSIIRGARENNSKRISTERELKQVIKAEDSKATRDKFLNSSIEIHKNRDKLYGGALRKRSVETGNLEFRTKNKSSVNRSMQNPHEMMRDFEMKGNHGKRGYNKAVHKE
jgi:hypothetical protein